MKKKVLSLLFAVILLVSLFTGCSSNKKDVESNQTKEGTPTVEPKVTEELKISEEPTIAIDQQPTAALEEPKETKVKEYPIEAIESAGTIDGITYSNSEIGFSISVPKSWLIFGTEDTYNSIAKSLGYADKEITTLKQEVRAKGVTYLFYGNDTQLSKNGNADRVTAEAINIGLFQGLGVEDIVKTLSKASVDQYTAKGGTCEVSEPVKTTIGNQNIYHVPTKVSYEVTAGDTTTKQVMHLTNIIFERDDTVVYMILSTDSKESEKLVKTLIETISFQ